MYPQSLDTTLSRINSVLENIKATGSNPQILAQLQELMNTLIENVFGTDGSASLLENGRAAETTLCFIEQMLEDRVASALCECGINSTALVLQNTSLHTVQISSQSTDEASAFRLRIIDSCLSKLVAMCDDAEKRLEKCITGLSNKQPSSTEGEVDPACILHVGLVCTEAVATCLTKLSTSESGMLLQSDMIWKSVLEGTNAIAQYLVRLFESSCRLFTHCTQPSLRREQKYAVSSSSLSKGAGKVMDQVSAVFGNESHLKSDVGRKRALCERYCEQALLAHRSIMSSPPQFKAVWKTLCTIITLFSASSFDSSQWCFKVYVQSCETVQMLGAQATAILQRAQPNELADTKLQRRVRGILAFIRFMVFQLPTFLPKIASCEAGQGDTRLLLPAMSMFDVLLGKLSAWQLQVTMPKEISTMADHLVSAVTTKFAVALLTSSPEALFAYLDRLGEYANTADSHSMQMPLLNGLNSTIANREVLRAVVSGIGSFSEEQQKKLLERAMPLPLAFAMVIDSDPASVFAITKGTLQINPEQQSSTSEYERLVCSLAQSATKLSTPKLFGLWEISALQAVLQAPVGSLGAQVISEAWQVVAAKSLSKSCIISTIEGVLDVAIGCPERIAQHSRHLVTQLLIGLFSACSDGERVQCISGVCDRVAKQNNAENLGMLCMIIPWHLSATESMVYEIGRKILDFAISALDKCNAVKEQAAVFWGLAALLPTYQLDTRPVANDDIWRHAYVVFEKALNQMDPDERWQQVVESILKLATGLSESCYPRTVELLELCGRNISNPMLHQDYAAFLLTQFAGSFASTDLTTPTMDSTVNALCQVFGRLFASHSWIVRHQACLQIIRFATESVNQSIAEMLVPNHLQDVLLKFIQRMPGGTEPTGLDRYKAAYQDILCQHPWKLPLVDERELAYSNGSGRDFEKLLSDICGLQQRLEATLQQPMPANIRETIQMELARLVQIIEQAPQS
ncbi:hypothetical protein IWW36_003847 [Coemansia brasiliensis]|uniref:Uncharacterized protein n=1 Tax=Coemansia brasiliensis TaxID=2650707 RepID=A0A9W8LWU1_9FUNG|nr:hypothetical protein IWW36_003847 [Coemansia brasiliensis]